ncbi:MAG: hypothetical protein HFJ52_02800 [Clostridia bacterium]|nr:hypothetical protein [Clostridia bacterium]
MRKILISILLLALLAIFSLMVLSGVTVGNITIGHSVKEVINKNDELDKSIAALDTKIKTEYQASKGSLESSFTKLQTEKQTYRSAIAYTTEEELKKANTTEQYKMSYLWTNIGGYASKEGVVLKLDVSYGSSGLPNQYNMAFTATGEYLSISEFIYAIEKDPNLGFRIEEFALVPYSENALQATFIIKNIPIDPSSISTTTGISGENSNGTQTKDSTNTTAETQQTNTTKNNNSNTVNTVSGS